MIRKIDIINDGLSIHMDLNAQKVYEDAARKEYPDELKGF